MTVQSRSTLKAYFETGDVMTAQSFIDLIDSAPNLIDSTAQTFNSDIIVPNLIATNVSAGQGSFAGKINASAATLTGRVRQGVSAAASAADSRGDFLVCQEGTVAAAGTAQVAFLPTTSNIAGLFIKVLVGGSAAAGGLKVVAGITGNNSHFGTITVSAVGLHEFVLVSARNLVGASGAVTMVASGASANTNVIGGVRYYQRV